MKEVTEIYEGMLAVFQEKTGFSMENSADLAVRLYAAAAEISSLYAYADWALVQAFPQTATGEYLDYHAELRGLERKTGSKAQGTLRFQAGAVTQTDRTIPAGTVCTTSGMVRFVTKEEGNIAAGSLYADVPAEAEEVGSAGNVAAGTVCYMGLAPTGVTAVSNPAAFTGGSEEEDDDALRERVLDSFKRLPNGANAAFYEQRALSHEGVGAVRVIPRYEGIGTVGVVVAAKSGESDAALITEIQEDLNAVREIAVDVTVMAPIKNAVDLTIELLPTDSCTFDEASVAVQTALAGYFNGERLGKPVYLAALGNVIYGTGLVKNYKLKEPSTDVAVSDTVLPVLGTVQITEAAT